MIRITSVILPIVLALLTGCASFKQNVGLEVQSKSAQVLKARQEPWHNVVLMGDLRKLEQVTVAMVNLPQFLPTAWKEELVDKGRTYTVNLTNGKVLSKPLERVVLRAAAYTEAGRFVEVFDAVVMAKAQGLLILLPTNRAEELKRYQFVILPSDASWLMTTQKEQVALPEGQDVNELPQGFFAEHPSPLRQTVVIKRAHPIFRDLLVMFPYHFSLKGTQGQYSGISEAETNAILKKFTSLETVPDKLISCGTLPYSPGMGWFGAGAAIVENAMVVNRKDCLNPDKGAVRESTGVRPEELL